MTMKAHLAALAAQAIKRGHPIKRLTELTAEQRLAREIQLIQAEKPNVFLFGKGKLLA